MKNIKLSEIKKQGIKNAGGKKNYERIIKKREKQDKLLFSNSHNKDLLHTICFVIEKYLKMFGVKIVGSDDETKIFAMVMSIIRVWEEKKEDKNISIKDVNTKNVNTKMERITRKEFDKTIEKTFSNANNQILLKIISNSFIETAKEKIGINIPVKKIPRIKNLLRGAFAYWEAQQEKLRK